LLPLEVHNVLSPEGMPDPDQLHEEAGHTTARILFGPERLTVIDVPLTETPLKVAGKMVPSAPNCDHMTESLAVNPDDELTRDKESARAGLLKSKTKIIGAIADRSAAAAC
jgi:hypothetical protein